MTLDDVHRLFASLTDLDTALRIHDCSNETLLAVAERLEHSVLPRHCILREAELDDLWRYEEPQLAPRGQDMEPQLAEALAALTTGIYVLTVRAGGVPHGMSSSWATQVSGDPILLMVAVDQQHVTHQMIRDSGAFALNIVGAQSKHLEDYFYAVQSRRPDNLAPFALETGLTGTPLLRDAVASLDCRVVSAHPAGDHTLFVGTVVEARVRTLDQPLTSRALPYVYLGGRVLFNQASRRPLEPG